MKKEVYDSREIRCWSASEMELFLQKLKDTLTEFQYENIDFSTGEFFDESVPTISWRRFETDQEERDRIQREHNSAELYKARELAELARLKEKYKDAL